MITFVVFLLSLLKPCVLGELKQHKVKRFDYGVYDPPDDPRQYIKSNIPMYPPQLQQHYEAMTNEIPIGPVESVYGGGAKAESNVKLKDLLTFIRKANIPEDPFETIDETREQEYARAAGRINKNMAVDENFFPAAKKYNIPPAASVGEWQLPVYRSALRQRFFDQGGVKKNMIPQQTIQGDIAVKRIERKDKDSESTQMKVDYELLYGRSKNSPYFGAQMYKKSSVPKPNKTEEMKTNITNNVTRGTINNSTTTAQQNVTEPPVNKTSSLIAVSTSNLERSNNSTTSASAVNQPVQHSQIITDPYEGFKRTISNNEQIAHDNEKTHGYLMQYTEIPIHAKRTEIEHLKDVNAWGMMEELNKMRRSSLTFDQENGVNKKQFIPHMDSFPLVLHKQPAEGYLRQNIAQQKHTAFSAMKPVFRTAKIINARQQAGAFKRNASNLYKRSKIPSIKVAAVSYEKRSSIPTPADWSERNEVPQERANLLKKYNMPQEAQISTQGDIQSPYSTPEGTLRLEPLGKEELSLVKTNIINDNIGKMKMPMIMDDRLMSNPVTVRQELGNPLMKRENVLPQMPSFQSPKYIANTTIEGSVDIETTSDIQAEAAQLTKANHEEEVTKRSEIPIPNIVSRDSFPLQLHKRPPTKR